MADVEIPGGERFEHHVAHLDRAAIAVVVNEQARVLLMWRHRFVFDRWGWELPGGLVEAGEEPTATAEIEKGPPPKIGEGPFTWRRIGDLNPGWCCHQTALAARISTVPISSTWTNGYGWSVWNDVERRRIATSTATRRHLRLLFTRSPNDLQYCSGPFALLLIELRPFTSVRPSS
ncbi:NUDIX domain-containing protein [Actinomadura sp. ATCC 39365]